MKDFIVLMGILPLLLVFIFQFACDYRGFEEVQAVEHIVYEAREKARQEGGFGDGTVAEIRRDIAEHLGVSQDEVQVQVSAKAGTVGRFDDERLIRYQIRVEVPGAMAGGGLFGIKPEDNKKLITFDGFVASEYVGGYQ